jgi:hypothetical protein
MAFRITAGPSTMRPVSPAAAAGCMTLFALPFGVAGLFMMFQSVRQMRHGTGSSALAMGIAGMTFTGIAVGMILGGRGARSSFARLEARRAAAPGQPWFSPCSGTW